MRDKKFAIALVIIVALVLVLLYLVVVGPSVQGFVVNKQLEGFNLAVEQVTQQVVQQGYVNLGTQDEPFILVRNQELESELLASRQQQTLG